MGRLRFLGVGREELKFRGERASSVIKPDLYLLAQAQ